MSESLENLKYPIGKFIPPAEIDQILLEEWINQIATLPSRLSFAIKNLSDEQLYTRYRPKGWTLRQVIHHLPDSHANSYMRFKLALTEDNPIIRPYFEDRWAECQEAKTGPVDISLDFLDGLHKRWVLFLKTLKTADFERTFTHPEHGKILRLSAAVGMYAWHGNHHLAHITQTIKRHNWS